MDLITECVLFAAVIFAVVWVFDITLTMKLNVKHYILTSLFVFAILLKKYILQ